MANHKDVPKIKPTTKARGGVTGHNVRYVLAFGAWTERRPKEGRAGTWDQSLMSSRSCCARIGGNMMRTKPSIIICSAALLVCSAGSLKAQQPAPDQTPPPAAAPSVSQDVDRDHRGDWGWIGLLGLIGWVGWLEERGEKS
jgi:hypothetical protein